MIEVENIEIEQQQQQLLSKYNNYFVHFQFTYTYTLQYKTLLSNILRLPFIFCGLSKAFSNCLLRKQKNKGKLNCFCFEMLRNRFDFIYRADNNC